MTALENLPADQRAVLQLVLQRGRSYDDIAALLSIDRGAVRQRALAAFDALGPQTGVPAQQRGLITDYLLGQLSERVAMQTRDRLGESPGERAWARVVASELTALANRPLPEIPVEGGRAAAPEEAAAAAAAAAATALAASPLTPGAPVVPVAPAATPAVGATAAAPESATAVPPESETAGSGDDGGRRGEPDGSGGRDGGGRDRRGQRSSRIGGALLIAGAVIIVAIAIIVITTSGSKSHNSSTSTNASAPTTSTPATSTTGSSTTGSGSTTGSTSTTPTKVIGQVNLTSPTSGSPTVGVAEVLRQGSIDGIAIVATHVPPNTKHDAYAVWLYNSPTDSHLLGFVNPGVSSNGKLSTAGQLPSNASHYKQLIVTLETQANPTVPAKIILQGALKVV